MNQKQILAVDGASFCWRGLLASKDGENGYEVMFEDKPKWINSAQHGYDNVLYYLDMVLKLYKITPIDAILVLEGKNSKSKRQMISTSYKAGKDKAPEQYVEFQKLRDMLERFWLDLGGQVLSQDACEGDDVLAWLAKNTEVPLVIATYDNDLAALNTDANAQGAPVEVWINELRGVNKYGGFDYDLITTYKALVGDKSDNIKGCVGFGPAKFDAFCQAYGYDGLREVHDMLGKSDLAPLAPLLEDPSNKLLRMIWDQGDKVIEAYKLARLRPEWVDTMMLPISWRAGMVRPRRDNDDIRFKQWYGQQWLVTGDQFDRATEWAKARILASREVGLDIETSGCDESDEWLAAQSRTGDAEDAGVDSFGHTLSGLSITFGDNNQYSMYFSVDHADTVNCDSERLRQFICWIADQGKPFIIHNMAFELTVLFNEWGAKMMDNGFHGFLPNVLDTALSCSYVDENVSRGLKYRTQTVLGYDQQTYKEVTVLTGAEEDLFPGGVEIARTEPTYQMKYVGTGEFEPDGVGEDGQVIPGQEMTKLVYVLDDAGEKVIAAPPQVTKRYRMNELPAHHVTAYGCDDTIVTMAHHNHNRLRCQIEHQWHAYLEVEIDAAYQHAKNFIDGVCVSLEKMRALQKADDETYNKAWAVVRQYLIDQGWEGTAPPTYGADIDPAQLKEAYFIVTGKKLNTMMRTMSKLVIYLREMADAPLMADLLDDLLKTGDGSKFTAYVRRHFKGEPDFNFGSTLQKQKLLYEVMGLPIRVRNKPTDDMKKAGIFEGNPKTDVLAISYALRECTPEQKEVLEAMRLIGMVTTRRTLYYNKYPYFPHWKDGKLHPNHNQSSTNTRRASMSKPNTQQLPKHPKIEGHDARFREVIVPHRPDAVIVSIDFKAQELRLMADYSQDPVMLSMYIGDNLRDQHTLTGLAIAQRRDPQGQWTYATFAAAVKDKEHPRHKFAKECRALGKKLNFTAEYGAQAEKVAMTLLITEEEAQEYLDAREAMFVKAQEWKEAVKAEARNTGIVRTRMGAVRHLRDAITSDNRSKSSKAERQAVNYKIQGSSGEQTKLSEGRMWQRSLFYRYDAVCYGPVHDEIVASVRIADLFDFIPEMHACMVAKYADMEVPIEGDVSFGWDYYNQIEIGAVPSREAIQGGLDELYKQKEAA